MALQRQRRLVSAAGRWRGWQDIPHTVNKEEEVVISKAILKA